MRLKRFLLRFFPPGLVLEYERSDGSRNSKVIDVLSLGIECVKERTSGWHCEERTPHSQLWTYVCRQALSRLYMCG
jgi:hypothetical protein